MSKQLLWFPALFFIFFFSTLNAQNPPDLQNLQKSYFDFFSLNRENVYLHLNKTTLIPGENLWLSAYIYNSATELPNPETTNLRVRIYDEQGQHFQTHTIFIAGGKGSSMISIAPNTFPPGTYYLKASTRYMENFAEDLSYLQPFIITGGNIETKNEKTRYDLQLLPEGGHLLTGSINSVGVKLIDQNGFGAAFSEGIIVDNEGNQVTRFHSNNFGMSRFFFTPLPNKEYSALVTTVDGQVLRIKVPEAREKGINLVATQRDEHFVISLRTNKYTREQLPDKTFLFTIHKDGKLKDLPFSFPKDELEVTILMPKDSLFPGANTLTIFNDQLNPILERMIFSEKTLKRERLTTSLTEKGKDSISFNLEGSLKSNLSLSVSVLPKDTESYDPAHNILSAFYLKPHLEGKIDEPTYYFSPGDKDRKLYDLDLLLLTQGWTRYNWWDVEPPTIEELNEHEKGFTVTGRVAKRNEKRQNTLFIGSEELFQMTEISEDGSFKLKNAFISDSTELAFGLMDEKTSRITKPSLNVNVIPKKPAEQGGEPLVTSRKFYYSAGKTIPGTHPDDFNELDTVVVNSKRHVFQPDLQIHERGIEITEEIADRYNYISDFIATKGFMVQHVQGQLEIRSTRISTFTESRRKPGNYRTAQSNVMLYFNGVPTGTDASFLNRLPTSQVESIVINKLGMGYGFQGSNGVIHINTKKGAFTPNRTERMLTVMANNGYTPNKEFYTPKYVTRNTAAYNRFAAVDWLPNLTFDPQGRVSIPLEKGQSFKLFIEGMGYDGSLVSEEFVVE